MADPFSSAWFYVALLAVSLSRGPRAVWCAALSGTVAYGLALLVRAGVGAVVPGHASFPSVSMALVMALGFWALLSGGQRGAGAAPAYVVLAGVVGAQRLLSGAHAFADLAGGIVVGMIAVAVVRRVGDGRKPGTGVNAEAADGWPTRSYLPPGGTMLWSRAEVAERYPDALSPLFADLFLPAIGRAVQRTTRRLGIKKTGVCIGYSLAYGYALSNMGPWVLNIGGVLRRFLHVRGEALRYFHEEYPAERQALWDQVRTLEPRIDNVGGRSPAEASLALSDAVSLAEGWMGQQTRSLFYITFGLYYLRACLLVHFPLRHRAIIRTLPLGLRTASHDEADLLFRLGTLLGDRSSSWRDLSGAARALADQLLRMSGDKTASYDFTAARWREQPDLILELARATAQRRIPPEEARAVLGAEREATEAVVRSRVARMHPLGGRQLGGDIVELSRCLYAFKEERQWQMAAAWGLVKRAALAVGQTLVASGDLQHDTDTFFLTASELAALVRRTAGLPVSADSVQSAADAGALVHVRRNAFRQLGARAAPEDTRGNVFEFGRQKAASTGEGRETLHGRYTLPGRVTARATVIRRLDEFHRLKPGHVLVAPMTNPNWDVLFGLAGGIVIEKGGLLSHPMLKASEYGIPGLVGVDEATRRIPDGALVLLDGDANALTILDHGNPPPTPTR